MIFAVVAGMVDLPRSVRNCSAIVPIEQQSEEQHVDLSARGDSDDLCSRGRDEDKGFNLKVMLSEYVYASIDNFKISQNTPSYLQRRSTNFRPISAQTLIQQHLRGHI